MTDLESMLCRHEGFRERPYLCPAGKTSIGYGRNLDDNPLTTTEGLYLLQHDIARVTAELHKAMPWMLRLPQAGQDVLINMGYNLGIAGLKGFRHFLAALQFGDWQDASDELLDSQWAEQVGNRAHELARIIRTLPCTKPSSQP